MKDSLDTSAPPEPEPSIHSQQVILLGASNIARAFPTLVHTLRQGLSGPLDILAAMGHGRAYGQWSQVLGRALPGLIDCRIWPHLGSHCHVVPTPLALITDLGNDLVYGAEAATLLGWLETILQRLAACRATIVLMSLPVASLARMTPTQFAWTRRLLFPNHPVTWNTLRLQVDKLDQGMRDISQRHGLYWVETEPDWYGIDPIHLRRACWPAAWDAVFSQWPGWQSGPEGMRSPPGLLESLKLRRLRPAEWRLLGRDFRTPQPVRCDAGYRLFLY